MDEPNEELAASVSNFMDDLQTASEASDMAYHEQSGGKWLVVLVDPDRWDAADKGLSFIGPYDDMVAAMKASELYEKQLNTGVGDDHPFETYVAPLWKDELHQ